MRRQSIGQWLGVLAVAAFGATAAVAADLPAPAPVAPAYHPPPPAHYNWSGFYFGGNLGVGWLRDTVTTTSDTSGAGFLNNGTQTTVNPFAVIGGAQAGLNLQFGPAVIGAEGTWTSSDISGNKTIPTLTVGTSEESRSAPHWFATATGKLGFAINDLLLYAKGGGAWVHVDYTQIMTVGGAFTTQQLLTDNRSGWTAGAGIEYALNENLSARLEYDFLDFGTKNYTFNLAGGGGPAVFPVSIQSTIQMLAVGVNYRFYFGGG